MRWTVVLAGAGVLALAGCSKDNMETGAAMPGASGATATLRTADGTDVGRATVTEVNGGLRFTVDGRGMPPGTHGAHVHTVGRCDAPTFETAGPHWNPTGMQHGTMNPQGPHSGDAPNLIVDSGGRGTLAVTIAAQTMASLLDADGAAFVIHANADDLRTDPSGNSGGRIACGVFARS